MWRKLRMLLEQKTKKLRFCKQSMEFTFLPDGDIFEFMSGSVLINQFQGNSVDGSANNIYLRIYQNEEDTVISHVIPLLGRTSKSQLFLRPNQALYFRGTVEEITYEVAFLPTDNQTWFWRVNLQGKDITCDLLYGQDISLADKGGVLSNELYISQYLDHHILSGEHGMVVCSRQNQAQGGKFLYLQQGALTSNIIRYSTDEMQFFGKSYKQTGIPEIFYKDLENINYQYELSYTALQTEKMVLDGEKTVVFYGCFQPDHREAVSKLEYQEEIKAAYEEALLQEKKEEEIKLTRTEIKSEFGSLYSSPTFTTEEKNIYFPIRSLEEKKEEVLLSCFADDCRHIVFQEKELLVERPHGNIVTTLIDEDKFEKPLITSTHYMYGFFNGQITVGNTNMNKMISVNRGLLNIQKNTGQRIYIKIGNTFRILALPAAFELGLNYSKWYYKIEDDLLTITSFANAEDTSLELKVASKLNRAYEFLITNQLVMGEHEFQAPCTMKQEKDSIVLGVVEGSAAFGIYPKLSYRIIWSGASFEVSDDRVFFSDDTVRNGTLLTLKTTTDQFKLCIRGSLEHEPDNNIVWSEPEEEYQKYLNFYNKFLGELSLQIKSDEKTEQEVTRLSKITFWYLHNALVHFAVPHGLEQSGGAAWGTRDVCQGPMELFLTTGHYALARTVLLKLFAHQNQNGEWPQWFMFDKYPYYAGDCHGDVVFWPLKAMGDYLKQGKDLSILKEPIGYLDGQEETILEHLKRAFSAIEERYLYDTALISYAGGDWDDTLQPADPAMKEKLVSAWTQALAYQTLLELGCQLKGFDSSFGERLIHAAHNIGKDFNRYLCKDGVIAGFAYFEDSENVKYMLHPSDRETGISYRLLPLTRSIIANLAKPEQKDKNLCLIEEHLACPDGIRLMDHPARYEGGVSKYFMRAEQAANVGREISLQYVHAHIRYIQALAAAGEAEKAWKGLLMVLPARLSDTVPNAEYRQSNAYFSSSEGAYHDRYEYQLQFERLRQGTIGVKGGWRIYSSGPGIYLTRWIADILGIRFEQDRLGLDPMLIKELSGLEVSFHFDSIPIKIQYLADQNKKGGIQIFAGKRELSGEKMENLYRQGGLWLKKEELITLSENGKKQINLTVLY